MTFLSEMDQETGLLEEAKVFDKGRDLRKTYQAGDPFPPIAIDDFVPEAVLERCLAEFPTDTAGVTDTYDRNQERFKRAGVYATEMAYINHFGRKTANAVSRLYGVRSQFRYRYGLLRYWSKAWRLLSTPSTAMRLPSESPEPVADSEGGQSTHA